MAPNSNFFRFQILFQLFCFHICKGQLNRPVPALPCPTQTPTGRSQYFDVVLMQCQPCNSPSIVDSTGKSSIPFPLPLQSRLKYSLFVTLAYLDCSIKLRVQALSFTVCSQSIHVIQECFTHDYVDKKMSCGNLGEFYPKVLLTRRNQKHCDMTGGILWFSWREDCKQMGCFVKCPHRPRRK